MMAIKLALRNLMGAGLRTWLNVSVLSFAFVVIVFYNGMLDGWNMQARNDTQAWETGYGQLWHPQYDRYDPFSFQDSHAEIPVEINQAVVNKQLTPVLIAQATIYPQGRMMNIIIKGIDPGQQILKFPSQLLLAADAEIPAIIGKRMAEASHLKKGDNVLLRWRDKNGTFDAREVTIIELFNGNVPSVDVGQVWVPIFKLQEMTGMLNEATLFVASPGFPQNNVGNWQFKNQKFLLKELDDVIHSKKAGSNIISGLLLAIALLAIFDTQVLSIFRRQREIGTYIALGMTRLQVIKIFTVEGSAHSILAIALAAIYGIPFLTWIHRVGIPMPAAADQAGIAISERIIPVYGMGMVVTTIALVVISATVVSYFPSRRISKMKPTDAIKGKIQ